MGMRGAGEFGGLHQGCLAKLLIRSGFHVSRRNQGRSYGLAVMLTTVILAFPGPARSASIDVGGGTRVTVPLQSLKDLRDPSTPQIAVVVAPVDRLVSTIKGTALPTS